MGRRSQELRALASAKASNTVPIRRSCGGAALGEAKNGIKQKTKPSLPCRGLGSKGNVANTPSFCHS